MIDYKKIITNRELRLKLIRLLSFIPDRPYLKLVYRIKTGKKLHLDNPVGFNEKLNWLKVNRRRDEYTKLVDKYEVRTLIAKECGEEYLFPLLGVWDRFEDIDFDLLPPQFVLKCTHDSGSVKIIRDKSAIDLKELSLFFRDRLKLNSFVLGREYPYKNVYPRIIAEKLMGGGKEIPYDYKFFCFNGEPKLMYIASDRESDCKFTFFDMDFNRINDIDFYIHPSSSEKFTKPASFDKMKEMAATLSKGIPFVRMDFYEIDGKPYFGEFTFFTGGGFYLFTPEKYENYLGSLIQL